MRKATCVQFLMATEPRLLISAESVIAIIAHSLGVVLFVGMPAIIGFLASNEIYMKGTALHFFSHALWSLRLFGFRRLRFSNEIFIPIPIDA